MFTFNIITVFFYLIFIIPIFIGAFRNYTRERVQTSFTSLISNLELLLGILLSVYLTGVIFFKSETGIFRTIYDMIPKDITNKLYGKDVLTYIIVVPIMLLIVMFIIKIVTLPLHGALIVPVSDKIYGNLSSISKNFKRVIGAVLQVPKALCFIFAFALLLNFYAYYFTSPFLTKNMSESVAYQFLYKNALSPVLNSSLAKQIPVIINDSFGKYSDEAGTTGGNIVDKLASEITGSRVKVIEYFNGVTLEEAVKSNDMIDTTANELTRNVENSKAKAFLIYEWICKNIKYDYDKALKVSAQAKGISSGSIIAFNTRKGICFDYSALYITMCRAIGLRVRLVTGSAFSGVTWGDHAWNEAYSNEEKRWINVDATFGTVENYFDKKDFKVDHKNEDIQGEW